MLVGTLIAFGQLMSAFTRTAIGVNPSVDLETIVGGAIGSVVLWFGARRWAMTLGVMWIILGAATCFAVPGLRSTATARGDLANSLAAGGVLQGGGVILTLGILLVVYQTVSDKNKAGHGAAAPALVPVSEADSQQEALALFRSGEDRFNTLAFMPPHQTTSLLNEIGVYYRRATEIDPTLGEAWFRLGQCLAKQGQRKDASDCYTKALGANLPSGWEQWVKDALAAID